MNWEYWTKEFKRFYPDEYVESEMARYKRMVENKDLWMNDEEAVQTYTLLFKQLIRALERQRRVDDDRM